MRLVEAWRDYVGLGEDGWVRLEIGQVIRYWMSWDEVW